MTQIIERVARGIRETKILSTSLQYVRLSEIISEGLLEGDPERLGATNRTEAIDLICKLIAQAALEEIKFEQLVGALEGLLGALGANRPEEELVTDFGMLGLDNINRTQALLSELEKTDA